MKTIMAGTLVALLGLGACAATGAADRGQTAACKADAAATLAGQAAPDDAAILKRTGGHDRPPHRAGRSDDEGLPHRARHRHGRRRPHRFRNLRLNARTWSGQACS